MPQYIARTPLSFAQGPDAAPGTIVELDEPAASTLLAIGAIAPVVPALPAPAAGDEPADPDAPTEPARRKR